MLGRRAPAAGPSGTASVTIPLRRPPAATVPDVPPSPRQQAAPTLTFLGATRTVTGSKFLLRAGGRQILVDCGLFQGLKALREQNWAPLPVDPAMIDAVVLTHAHLDHCGYLPRLVRDGFRGEVLCTPGTAALAGVVLPDSGYLQEEEAAFANRMGYSRHRPAQPLYTKAEAERVAEQLSVRPFAETFTVADGVEARFDRAGHILGSSVLRLQIDGGPTMVASGDLGRPQHPLLVPPDPPGDVDWLLIESTYGDRRHDDERAVERLGDIIRGTIDRGGSVLIPAFAVDRTEVLLYHLGRLAEAGLLPEVPVYVDSPMALTSLRIYRQAIERGDPDVRPELRGDGTWDDIPGLVEVRDAEASERLNRPSEPSIIISASGMATGGRVVHHLFHQLPHRENTVVLIGFQAAGTRGRSLAEGARELKMLGQYVRVRAEVVNLPSFSVHADQAELLAWAASATSPPATAFVVHGEEDASLALRDALVDRLDWSVVVPKPGETIRLDRPRR